MKAAVQPCLGWAGMKHVVVFPLHDRRSMDPGQWTKGFLAAQTEIRPVQSGSLDPFSVVVLPLRKGERQGRDSLGSVGSLGGVVW